MKKIITILSAISVAAGLLSACQPKSNNASNLIIRIPTMVLSNPVNPDISNCTEFFEQAAEAYKKEKNKPKLNITVETFEYTKETETIVGSFDTPNATDILFEGYFNMQTYIHTGKVIPLNDMIPEAYKSNVNDSLWDMSTIDGKIYMLPFLSSQNFLVYNKDLFSECGLEEFIAPDGVVTSWTLEQWEYILDTLAKKLPENSYPIMMYAKNDQGDTHIMTFLRSHGCGFFDENGNVSLTTPEGIAALQWLQDGIDKNWYPPYCANLELVDNNNLFSSGQLAISMSNNVMIESLENINIGIVNFPDITGKGIVTSFVSGFEIFDNGDDKKIELAKDFINYILSTEEFAACSTSGIPADNTVTEKYHDELFMVDELSRNSSNTVDFNNNSPNWRGVRNVFYKDFQTLLTKENNAEKVAAMLEEDCNAAISSGRAESTLHE